MRIDYWGLEEEVKAILDTELVDGHVDIEREFQFASESTPWVGIYLDRRDAPASLQPLAAGKQTRMLVRLRLDCRAYSLESIARASQFRDELIGRVEVALMKHRDLNGKATASWLEGGSFSRVPQQDGWISGGEVMLVADVKATT
jgi:hypothetical protein